MTPGVLSILVTLATYLLMLVAFALHRRRGFHMPVMAAIIVYDVCFPIYLVMTRDFYLRLIEHEEILSFGVWMHLMVVVVLYFLYVFQIRSALAIRTNPAAAEERHAHRSQAIGILITRGLVIFTGFLLYDPQYVHGA